MITEQKVETLQGSADAHVDPNLFTVLARVKKPADLGYVEKAIDDEIARIAREGVDDKTLAEVQSHVKYAFAGQLSTPDKTAYTASPFLALTGDLGSINAYFALYDKVTSADVEAGRGQVLHAAEPHRRHHEGRTMTGAGKCNHLRRLNAPVAGPVRRARRGRRRYRR